MPIQVDGSAIGKLYAFNGTDFDRIAKAYEFNGEGFDLIFSAEEAFNTSVSVVAKQYYNYLTPPPTPEYNSNSINIDIPADSTIKLSSLTWTQPSATGVKVIISANGEKAYSFGPHGSLNETDIGSIYFEEAGTLTFTISAYANSTSWSPGTPTVTANLDYIVVDGKEAVKELVLYENGVINTEVAGSLTTAGRTGGASIVFNETDIALSYKNDATNYSHWSRAIVWTSNAVNLSEYSTLNVQYTTPSQLGQMHILINDTLFTGDDNPQLHVIKDVASTETGVLSMDVSEYTGSYYLAFMGTPYGGWNYWGAANVTKFWLE